MTGKKNKGLKDKIIAYKKEDKESAYFFAGLTFFAASIMVFLHMVFEYYRIGKWGYDSWAFQYFQSIRNDVLDSFFKTVTLTGNTVPMIIITLGISMILFILLRRKEYAYFSLNVLGAWVLNEGLKAILRRPRPVNQRLIDLTDMTKNSREFGFPSGHSMVLMAIAVLLVYFILIYSKKDFLAYLSCAVIILGSLAIGISRVYLGVHYLSDVLAGWAVGILWASGSIMFHRYSNYRSANK